MRARTWATASTGAILASLVAALPVQAAEAAPATRVDLRALDWSSCEDLAPVGEETLECATLTVPMARGDHAASTEGHDATVDLALSRVPATGTAEHTLLVNPGGPGSPGRMWAAHTHQRMSEELREVYDVVSFDPRGVGASTPAVACDPDHFTPARPDTVPDGPAEEAALRERAEAHAQACADNSGPILEHMRTEDTAHDMDAIRAALGVERIDYLGYSYGTYLGTVYSALYPERVRALVLDSVVNPDNPWYESNHVQSRALDRAAGAFFSWVADHDDAYGLGDTGEEVADAYYALRERLGSEPAAGTVGPTELEGAAIVVAYSGRTWPAVASALSAQVNDDDSAPLVGLHEAYGDNADSDNGYAGYLAVQCTDAHWPRDWETWRSDTAAVHEDAPFMAWHNTSYNAPCATWSAPSGDWFRVDDGSYGHPAYTGEALIVHATGDGATPVEGAHSLHRRLTGSALVIEDGGLTHGVALTGNACVDEAVSAYLLDGELPEAAPGADLTCEAGPPPQPRTAQSEPAPDVQRFGPFGLDRASDSPHMVE
ncbi:TAP-like protein [Nocardiopsis sp. Huas11]|uniref:alpha/beta hydrolase n=1 Tax=Nocardiopsis sp. Huas11 TaxID=2183912 RepID=UPI000EAE49F5|nr:alpha/beta hydrolase [Nocardiopsis sp. Huas11]RKS05199.1 TAP-like protein [Nocardiopsis sp. Huas11]